MNNDHADNNRGAIDRDHFAPISRTNSAADRNSRIRPVFRRCDSEEGWSGVCNWRKGDGR